jgi:hypothetical protein
MIRPMPGPFAIMVALGCASASILCAGCDDKKKASESAPSGDAGASTDKYATADPKLEKALQAAAAATGTSENGPPPEGIFAPGVADRRHAKGLPTTVEMIGDGNEPRIALAASGTDALKSSYGPAAMELGMQMGPRVAMPTVDFGFALAPAKKDDGGVDWLVGDVRRATPAKEQLGELPPGTDKAIASLEGSAFRIKISGDGVESDVQIVLGKGAHEELDRLARSAAEALVFATVPMPPKPVGVGAQWIAETRMPLSGVDVIAYRAFRLKSIDGARVHLSLDVKAYAAGTDTALQGVPKGATLEQVDAQAQGELELVRGEILARKSDVQQRVVLVFLAPGGPDAPEATEPGAPPGQPPAGKTLTAQMQTQATFVRGDDLRAALRP